VGQSGGPTAVINGSLAGVIEQAISDGAVARVLGMRRGIEGFLDGEVLELSDMDDSALDVLATTPGAALGACRLKITDEQAEAALSRIMALDVRYLCYIGGNDSADTTHRLARLARDRSYELSAIAVPKTIDNDLPETDHCPGYGSIARYVAIATAESTLDTRSLPTSYPVKIIEVMGRDAGWVAAASTLARENDVDGPHLIYVPEQPFDSTHFLHDVHDVHREVGYVVVVATETIRDAHGVPVAVRTDGIDSFGHPIVRGAADALVVLVESELGLTARVDKPGTLQRSSALTASPVDLAEARDVGRAAVRLAVRGESDRMVTLVRTSEEPYRSSTASVSLDRVANQQRLLPSHYLTERGTDTTPAFRDYALPLLGPNPIPRYASLPRSTPSALVT
jgi:6-phosphofructokinase 1